MKTLIIFSIFATIYCGCLANSTLEMQEVISEPDILIMNPGSRFLVEDIAREEGCDDDMENIECFKQIGPEELVAEARGTCCYRRRVCRWYSNRRICRYIRRCRNCPSYTPVRRNPVNCIWSNWRSYSSCSKTCGGGIQSRSRYKTRREANGGSCYGSGTMTRACNTQNCPIDCKWSVWSSCSEDCGLGNRTRSIEVMAQHGGQNCTGEKNESCKIKECPGEHIFPINGDVSLTKGNHVWSISDWSDEFKVEYDVIVKKELSETWASLFHVTTGQDQGEGGRLPAVFVNQGKYFLIDYHVNGNTNYGQQYNYELNKEYHFEISQQTNSKGEAVYSIKVNGETFHEIVNTTPLKFKDVKLYLSDPWYDTFEPFGKLSNLKVNADLTQ